MESPIKKHKELQSINGIKDIAYETLFTKYIVRNEKGDDKKWELESTDQESLMASLNGGLPIPGFIYTFLYPPKENENVIIFDRGKEKEYVDYVPIVFCTSLSGRLSFKGINLNTLPNIERVKFLEGYYRAYRSFFKDIEKITQNDKLALNMKFISAMSGRGAEKIVQVFSKKASANFGYGYITYDMKRIRQFRMIEYTEWDYIPFYEPKNAFKLMNQKQIHDLYYRSKRDI